MKGFILGEFQSDYEGTTITEVPGKSPEAIFYNEAGEEVERIAIDKYSRSGLVDLMKEKGIQKKEKTVEHKGCPLGYGGGGHDEI